MSIRDDLAKYTPFNEQEAVDKEHIAEFIDRNENAFLRENTLAHITASSWIVNRERTKVLMVYHKIYDSWSWTGGHADGEKDLLSVALRECREETGVKNVRPVFDGIYSLEILPVSGHEKRGRYIPSHLHYNITYLLEADENDSLFVCEDENSGVKWFPLSDALNASAEPWFVKRVYSKLNDKLKQFRLIQVKK